MKKESQRTICKKRSNSRDMTYSQHKNDIASQIQGNKRDHDKYDIRHQLYIRIPTEETRISRQS